jgi:hypothetical protein
VKVNVNESWLAVEGQVMEGSVMILDLGFLKREKRNAEIKPIVRGRRGAIPAAVKAAEHEA